MVGGHLDQKSSWWEMTETSGLEKGTKNGTTTEVHSFLVAYSLSAGTDLCWTGRDRLQEGIEEQSCQP